MISFLWPWSSFQGREGHMLGKGTCFLLKTPFCLFIMFHLRHSLVWVMFGTELYVWRTLMVMVLPMVKNLATPTVYGFMVARQKAPLPVIQVQWYNKQSSVLREHIRLPSQHAVSGRQRNAIWMAFSGGPIVAMLLYVHWGHRETNLTI